MRRIAITFPFLLLLFSLRLGAQSDSVLITKNFKFTDGLYRSFEEFQADQPAYRWEDIRITLASNPQTFMIQVERIITLEGDPVPAESLWGLCLQGIPYIRLDPELADRPLPAFSALRVRGKLSFFEFPVDTVEKVAVAAYNPLTGRPFRQGAVDKTVTYWYKYLIPFETGQLIPFTLNNFLRLIADDRVLHRTFSKLTPEEAEERLFKGVLIYDDRNPVYLVRE